MRRRADASRSGPAAGALSGRPRAHVVCAVALSIAAHAAISLAVRHGAMPTETARAATFQVRLIEASARLAAVVAPIPAPEAAPAEARTASPRRAAVAKPRVDAPAAVPVRAPEAVATARDAAVADAPVPPADPINGAVFGLPHIGFAAGAVSTGWMRIARPPASPAQAAPPDPSALANLHAQREARRAQLTAALDQRIGALPAPVGDRDGSCALGTPAARLECDNAALHDAVMPQAAALSGLLQAYRSIDSRVGGLSIGFSNGRYEVSLAWDAAP